MGKKPNALNLKLIGIIAVVGVATVLLLGFIFHAMGLNSHGWMVLILLVVASAALLVYKKLNTTKK
jgi:hypothetical protein